MSYLVWNIMPTRQKAHKLQNSKNRNIFFKTPDTNQRRSVESSRPFRLLKVS